MTHKCGGHSIQMAVACLCTRVLWPNKEDYKKLARVMQYICGTRDMTLTLEPDLNWWVNSSYTVHLYLAATAA